MRTLPVWVQKLGPATLLGALLIVTACAGSKGTGGTGGVGGGGSGIGGLGGSSGDGGSSGFAGFGGFGGSAGDAGDAGIGGVGGVGGQEPGDQDSGAIVDDGGPMMSGDAQVDSGALQSDASTPEDAGTDAFVIDMDAALADAGIVIDANVPDVEPDSRAAYCIGQGPPVVVNDSRDGISYDVCTGAIAGRVFTNSICSCDDVELGGFLRTRSFNSRFGQTPDMAIDQGAPVGINDSYRALGYTDVGGTMVIAGDGSTLLYQYMHIGGDLRMNGMLGRDASFLPTALGFVRVRRDGWFRDGVNMSVLNIVPTGIIEIGRDLHVPSGATWAALATVNGAWYLGNTPNNQPFTVEPPCACGNDDILDIGAMVDRARIHNDNAEIGLSPDEFNLTFGLFVERTLPCGRFYVNSIGSLGIVTLHVPGRTALFVGGDVGDLGIFDVDLGPEGELDIFIKGNLVSIGGTSFGDRNRPSATRVYVSGTGDVAIVGLGEFVGNVYAPRARIFSAGYTRVYGSLFGRRVDMLAGLDVIYDRDIVDIGNECPPPTPEPVDAGVPVGGSGGAGGMGGAGGTAGDGGMGGMGGAGGEPPPPPPVCEKCSNSCAGRQACVNNMCVGCSSDSDCCAPLVCYPSSGRCGPLLE